MADYIPDTDANFDTWQINFLSYASVNMAALGLVAGDLTPLTALQNAWNSNYTDHVAAQAAAEAARDLKQQSRTAYIAAIRELVRRLQASPAVSDDERLALGITVKGPSAPVGPPTTRPVAIVTVLDRWRQTVAFVDETTPGSKAKPAGALGCEIWVKVGGPPPANASEVRFLGLDTRTPYVAEFDGADAGQSAHYMLRWVNGKGEAGPWSATVTATIPA